MFSYLYNTLVYKPLYNGLIYLMDILPAIDAGVAVIIFTILVRLVLFPLSKKSIITQVRMKEIEPEINKLKNTVKDKQKQALMMMELYKEKGVKPFFSIFLILIQLPIIFALYSVFMNSGLPVVNESILYSFVMVPIIDMNFLGWIDISMKSFLLSLIAAVAQYLQLHYSFASKPPTIKSSNPSEAMIQNMTQNMKYVFPVIIFFISYNFSSVVAIYLAVGSLFTLAQELYVRHTLRSEVERP